MPSQTTGKNLPYPLGTDRLMDGDDQIRKLAQSVDNMAQAGNVVIAAQANAQVTAAVTFPVAYAAAPVVSASFQTAVGASASAYAWATNATATGVTIGVLSSNATNRTVNWQAIGPVVAVA